jgi:two-component system, OmpR family, phosphate regulon sensor histidine kinase PhoR
LYPCRPVQVQDELFSWNSLIQNALIYTSDGGRITIETKDYANSVLIAIEDTGIGISGADLPFIFQRLYRVNKARTHTEESGAGLGLAMVKRVIDLHRGTIAVSSNIGIGTRFDIQLPKDPRVSNHDKLEFSHSYRLPTI